MPGNLQNLEGKSQLRQFAALAVPDGTCALRNTGIVRPDHGYRPMAQQLRDAADMIRVMVSE